MELARWPATLAGLVMVLHDARLRVLLNAHEPPPRLNVDLRAKISIRRSCSRSAWPAPPGNKHEE
jgi:hypothetical protein